MVKGFVTALKPGGKLLVDFLNVPRKPTSLHQKRCPNKGRCSTFTVASTRDGLRKAFNSNGREVLSTTSNG